MFIRSGESRDNIRVKQSAMLNFQQGTTTCTAYSSTLVAKFLVTFLRDCLFISYCKNTRPVGITEPCKPGLTKWCQMVLDKRFSQMHSCKLQHQGPLCYPEAFLEVQVM